MEKILLNTAVVGSGAAGFNAALRLHQLGVKSVALITEGKNMGTSRNTGSDKQTYYKLSLAGDMPDSVAHMAEDLFAGGCVDGDNALAEAALSARCFFNLCELGVPFPVNRYGEYVGYKTDHDPCARATSVGPLTSKHMTEALEAAVAERNIPIYDRHQVISILQQDGEVCGLLCLRTDSGEPVLVQCKNVIYATGGPAGMYADSVYPLCHSGASGVAFEAGILGQNLTEWQYGLASVFPRWNVSGTYMQVLPRMISVDPDGTEHEFLLDYFRDEQTCLQTLFLKGYQWPFDSRKIQNGSSIIDLLVYRECSMYGRRVYLDYRSEPFGHPIHWEVLTGEAKDYLSAAGAMQGSPIERLAHMNQPAIDLYASKGVDLYRDRLEIALCAQHNNGGLAVDRWWQTNLRGFFAVGEVAGTHGIYRPGGSALNAGQVGSLRAAQYIAVHRTGDPALSASAFDALAEPTVAAHRVLCAAMLHNPDRLDVQLQAARVRMSRYGGAIRVQSELQSALASARQELSDFSYLVGAGSVERLCVAYRLRDLLISQITYLSAMLEYSVSGKTRGSALYYDVRGLLCRGLDECFRFTHDCGAQNGMIRETLYSPQGCQTTHRPVRPLPQGGGFFETVWRSYRENRNVD